MKSVSYLLPALVLLAGCAKHPAAEVAAGAQLPPARVRTAAVTSEKIPSLTAVTGTVRPIQRAQLAAKLMGAIEEMPVTLGQSVHTGDLLVKISAGEITARVAQAQAQLNVARRDLARERELLPKGASTADLVRGLEDRLTVSQAMLREAEVMLGYAEIRAPFDGVVARTSAHRGDLAAPGMVLLEIEGTTDFQVEAAVPDSLAARLVRGIALTVELPGVGVTFTGSLAEVSSTADSQTRSVLVKISVPANTVVRSGEFARVQVPGAPVPTLLVPATALSSLGQMERIFVVGADSRAGLRLVKSGPVHGDRVEILSGLDAGERVVVNPPAGLREGQALEFLP
jgi:membrane fusion protein, multidrug efflux system